MWNSTNQFDKAVNRAYNTLHATALNTNTNTNINTNKIFYICSYGGSGSYMLANYLSNFGKVFHIHSRYPPKKLTYTGCTNATTYCYKEWFNDVQIADCNLHKYIVIYIYRNPIHAIYSRFENKTGTNPHLSHIQCNPNIKLQDVIDSKKDLYGIKEFFNNYTKKENRNYEIYCVKYEDFWDNIETFNKTLEIQDIKHLYPIKHETNRPYKHLHELNKIYSSLICKMNSMKFIEKV
jgi:hypothetical protein